MTTTVRLLAALFALAVLAPAAMANPVYDKIEDTFYLRGEGCGATENLYLDDRSAVDEYDGCGTIGGLPVNEAIGAARALLKTSLTDSRLDIDVPLARHAISSVGALSFKIGDLSNPRPAQAGGSEIDLTSFAALTTQVDAPAMSDMLNNALATGPVSLPDAVAMLDTAYLGHVIVLWSWALKQPLADTTEETTVPVMVIKAHRARDS